MFFEGGGVIGRGGFYMDEHWYLQWNDIEVYRAWFFKEQSDKCFERIKKLQEEIELLYKEEQDNMAQHIQYMTKIQNR